MTMNLNLIVSVHPHDLASQLAQLEHDDFIELVTNALGFIAQAEVDEELIARLYRGLEGCYDVDDPQPTIEELLKQYPEVEEEGIDQ